MAVKANANVVIGHFYKDGTTELHGDQYPTRLATRRRVATFSLVAAKWRLAEGGPGSVACGVVAFETQASPTVWQLGTAVDGGYESRVAGGWMIRQG